MSAVATASLLPEPAPRRNDEERLNRDVVQFLGWVLPDDATFYHVPNGGLRSRKVAARLTGMGVKAGIPDLAIVYRGRALFIELKAKRGVVSAAQKAMTRKLTYCGAAVMLCRSVPEVEAQLRECGMRLRGTVLAAIMKTPEDGPPALPWEQCDEQDRKTPASDSRHPGAGRQGGDYPQVGRGASRRGRRLAPAPGAAA